MKIAGSGSISQRHESADPDPHQNVMDPQHCLANNLLVVEVVGSGREQRAGQVRHQQALQHRVVEGEDQQKDDFTT